MDGVIVSASGSHVTKAVTVVELLKRRVPVSEPAIQGMYMYLYVYVYVGLTNGNFK